MYRRASTWQVKRPLFTGGLIAVAVTAVALKCSITVTLACVVPFLLLLCWKRMWLCAIIALCFLLVATGYRHHYVLPAEKLSGQIDTIQGQVVESPNFGRMYTVRITDSAYLPYGSRVMLHCTDEEAPRVNDTITAQVELVAVKENQTYYASRRAFACAFLADEEGSLRITHHATQTVGLLQRFRSAVVRIPRVALPTRESGLLAALCFGETGFVEENDTDAFRGSGLSHLLVVSGLHLSMVALAIRRLLHRFGMYPCCLLTLCAVWLFALFVGTTPSILRAAVMISLWLVGCLLFRHSDGLNALGLAALLLLAANPYTLWNAGFQLSFAATLGALLLTPRLMPRQDKPADDLPWWQRLWRWLRHTLTAVAAVSVSALLFSLPIACYHYGGFPLTSLPANMLAAPVAGVTMLLGWLGALCGLVPFFGWLSNGLLLSAGLLMRYMTAIAHWFSPHWAWRNVSQLWQWLLLMALCAVVVGGLLCRIPHRRVGVVLLALTVLTAGVGLPLTTAPIRLTIVPVDNEGGFILQQGTQCALIVTQAQEIDEVTYETASFEPDVLFVLGGDASAITQLSRWPQATVIAATPTDWTGGIDIPLTPLSVGDKVALWDNASLVRLSEEWTLLQAGDYTLCIGTDPDRPCPYPDGWHIYVGGMPSSPPDTPYTIVCNDTWLRRHRPTLTGQETILYDETATFTPLRGEWRRLLWLWL